MDIRGKKVLVSGGAGLIGSHCVEELVKEDVAEVVVYDNFVRGTPENLAGALRDPRVRVFDIGGDICQPDILRAAIVAELAAPRGFVYSMPRCNRFLGRWLRHGEGYPDRSIRLFHRGHAQ